MRTKEVAVARNPPDPWSRHFSWITKNIDLVCKFPTAHPSFGSCGDGLLTRFRKPPLQNNSLTEGSNSSSESSQGWILIKGGKNDPVSQNRGGVGGEKHILNRF